MKRICKLKKQSCLAKIVVTEEGQLCNLETSTERLAEHYTKLFDNDLAEERITMFKTKKEPSVKLEAREVISRLR